VYEIVRVCSEPQFTRHQFDTLTVQDSSLLAQFPAFETQHVFYLVGAVVRFVIA
jgi:hypothetical protein